MALRRPPAPPPAPPSLATVRALMFPMLPTPEDYAFAQRMEAEVLSRLLAERRQ